ncbi:putative ubiquitin-like-specific protease 1B [Apium graveolens]|uniref:putative ubiquitin-like-specific protease 1B n=1 Tax=Apium graveolens TaxID=4045 RepID=UPI003D7B679E
MFMYLLVEVQSPADVPPTNAPTPVSIPPQVDYTTPTPFHRSMTFQLIPLKMPITPESLEASSSLVTPYVHLGIGESSVPSELRDMFDMDSIEDLVEDAVKRGGPEQRGDMTRPLKNRKVRWLYRHFWSLEVDYIWRDHSERGFTYPLTHSQVTTLRPEFWVEDDVLNAYGELLRLREDKLWEKWEKIPRTESFKPRRYFIASSFFMAMALEFCPNLKASPSTLKGDAKKSMERFFRDYANKGGNLPLQFCDFAFFPTCDSSHWFLFVVNLNKMRVLNIDPLRDDKDTTGNIAHPFQYYIMEKLIPYMLNYLHPSRFPLKYTRVHGLDARPKQDGGNDCGVYVSKYMDAMLNGISLPSAVWNPKVDVQTFRYRMAHELSKGVPRHISEWGIRQREAGH